MTTKPSAGAAEAAHRADLGERDELGELGERDDPEILHLAAFAAEPGGGNPAGIVLDAAGLSTDRMQAIAARVGHPETAFVVDPAVDGDERRVRVRYFSPAFEVPFCGHATVAAAVVLAGQRGLGAFTIETAVGPLVIETVRTEAIKGGQGGVTASFTSVDPAVRDLDPEVGDALLDLLGLAHSDLDERWPLREAFAGNWHPIVALRSRAAFDAFTFDPAALRILMDSRGWAGTVTVVWAETARETETDDLDVEARNLFPVGEITEDPATGSAAAALGGYLRELSLVAAPARIVIRQGRHVGRPSVLVVDVPESGGIRVSGTAGPLG